MGNKPIGLGWDHLVKMYAKTFRMYLDGKKLKDTIMLSKAFKWQHLVVCLFYKTNLQEIVQNKQLLTKQAHG